MNIKLIIEETLHKIDSFFKEKSKKDIYMIYIMIVILFFSLAYPFYDSSLNNFNTTKKRVQEITTKINIDNIYLKVNSEAKVARLNQDIKKFETELSTQIQNNRYIKNRIEAISSLIYDEKAWGDYINSISINAKENSVKIINFTNNYSQNKKSSFGHVLDISLKIKGDYINSLKFINSLEKSNLVVDIHDFSIKAQEALNTDLNISVWGITY